MDQNVFSHTTGAYGGTPLVNGAGQAGEKHGEALALARRALPVQFGNHFGKAVPVGDFQPALHATLEFLATQGEQTRTGRRFGFGQILGAIFHVHHARIGNEVYPDLPGQFRHGQVGVRMNEIFTSSAIAVRLMLTACDQQAAAVVARNDGAQQQGAGASLARRSRQQRQLGRGRREAFADGEKAPHQTEIGRCLGDVPAHLGMQEQVGLVFDRTFQTEFELRAMHRLACLPGHHTAPAAPRKQRAQFGRGGTQTGKIRMRRQGRPLDHPAQMPDAVSLPCIADGQYCEHETFTVAQGHPISRFQVSGGFLLAGERDRQGPERAIFKLTVCFDALALRTRHEASER